MNLTVFLEIISKKINLNFADCKIVITYFLRYIGVYLNL